MPKSLDQDILQVINDPDAKAHLGRLAETFELSARRWELIVYPSLLAFITLASYGFFLVYSLTSDVHDMKEDMHKYLSSMAADMNQMTSTVGHISTNINHMTGNVDVIAGTMATMHPLLDNMTAMKGSFHEVTVAVSRIRNDFGKMTTSAAKPMNFIDSFMP